MNPDELPEALEELIPPKPSASGWGERIRRRRRNRRAGAAAAAGVAAVAVLAAAVQLGGQPTITATPMPADPSTTEPVATRVDPTVCAESVRGAPEDHGFGIEDMSRAVVCGPVVDDPDGVVQIELSDQLAAEIVAEVTSEDRLEGFQPGIGHSAPSLVLLSEHGDPLTLQGTPDRYRWYPPPGEGGIHMWTPSPELAQRMWDEIAATGQCTVSDPTFTCDGQQGSAATQPVTPDPTNGGDTEVGAPEEPPFTSEDVEDAWFDDDALAELPSSVRTSVETGREGYADMELAPGDVDVDVEAALDDLIQIRTVVHEPGGLESGWTEYHRLLGGNESEGVFSPAADHCFAAGQAFLEGGSIPDSVPAGGLPDNPEFVAICLTGLLQARSMPFGMGVGVIANDEAGGAQAAVDAYNALPLADAACKPKDGAWGFIVYHYGDGAEYLLQVRDNECGSVVAGNEHRRGGDEFRVLLWELLWEER